MTQDNLPLKSRLAASHDPTAKHEVEIMERALLYVALTRAKHAALITAPGKLSPWVLSRGGPQQSNPGRMVESR
jgi:superfamily I DNA/RNA helicase